MVIYQKLLPQTKKRGVFDLSLKISSLNRLASYDEYPPACGKDVKIPSRGGGGGVICMLHTTTRLPATKCPLFHKLKYGHPTKLVDSSSTGGTCLISLTDTIQLLSLLSPSLITRSLILF